MEGGSGGESGDDAVVSGSLTDEEASEDRARESGKEPEAWTLPGSSGLRTQMGTRQGVSQAGAQRCPLLGTQAPAQPVWVPVPALLLTVTPTIVFKEGC